MTSFSIKEHQNAKGFDVSFKTGSATIPDQEGGYIISTGCGSGKTESIKDLIRKKFEHGVLYCVDTRLEAIKIHDWVLSDVVGLTPLKQDDVVLLHGENKEELWEYKNNPELLMLKKVIILTHVRFWTDIINYFLIYRPKQEVPLFLGDFKTLMQRGDLRQYVIFDETPIFLKPFCSIPSSMFGGFSEDKNGTWQCKSLEGIYKYYDKFVEGTDNDLFKTNNKLNSIKKETVLNCIPKYFDYWMAMKNPSRYCINFYPKDLIQPGMKTHVLVYEGAGDILLGSSKAFTLIDLPNKYNSIVNFIPFEFNQKRKEKVKEYEKTDTFKAYIDNLAAMIRKHNKTLVVVWKYLGKMKDMDEGSGESAYTQIIGEKLLETGLDTSQFEVIYYGSAQTKSTNNYRDCDAMILAGNWGIPASKTKQIREAYLAETTDEEHNLWYFIQLITRIGIRNHDGGEYHVYYSNDYNASFIQQLDDYFNKNQFYHNREFEAVCDWIWKLKKMKIRKNLKEDIVRLWEHDNNIANAILDGKGYDLKISLDEISKLIPRKGKKDWDSYGNLKKKLALFNIRLVAD